MSASTENLNLRTEILISGWRIFNNHPLHFYALSTLFLLPLFFSLVLYPSFHCAFILPHFSFAFQIIVPILYSLLADLLYLCGTATITCSALQAFYGRPLSVASSIKSVRNSFLPLLSTFTVSQTISISITLLLIAVFAFVFQLTKALGLYHSDHFVAWFFLGWIVFWAILTGLQVDWSLAYVVAVVESKCALEAMKRSACLVKGKRWLVFRTMFIYGLATGALVLFIAIIAEASRDGYQWRSSQGIFLIIEILIVPYLLVNRYLVVSVIMYIYFKGNAENLPLQIGNVAGEYLVLPLNDDDSNHPIV